MRHHLILFSILLLFSSSSFAFKKLDQGKVITSSFVSGTLDAYKSTDQHCVDSTKIIDRVNIQGGISLKGNGATPLNYIEILRLDSTGIVYSIISLWHLPYRVRADRIQVSRTIINNSSTSYDFPAWTGLKVTWILYK